MKYEYKSLWIDGKSQLQVRDDVGITHLINGLATDGWRYKDKIELMVMGTNKGVLIIFEREVKVDNSRIEV